MKKALRFFMLSGLLIVILVACTDYDDELQTPVNTQVKEFVWRGLNNYYFWQSRVEDLSDDRFANQQEKTAFLNNYNSPTDLFNGLLYQRNVVDRFSVIFSDYNVLEQALTGTSKSNGIDYELKYRPGSTTEVFGWVRYILPDSDASRKNIKRGDIFYAVNGIALTNTNYNTLLEGDTYNLNLANYDNGAITPNGNSVSLSKSEFSENPVLLRKVIQLPNAKVGYLVYNGFYMAYESQLNEAFTYFASQEITHLVLDLRYNSGGAVVTATRLASMITGQFNNQVFGKQLWNEKVMSVIESQNPERVINRFTTTLNNNSVLTSLQLNKLYVLTSNRTASASELIINGLQPYINVVQIGDKTTGKNMGSITLYDSPDFTKRNINPTHRYAMQPLTFTMVNKNGFGEYQNGIQPTFPFIENLGDLGTLGEENEPFLQRALAIISGGGRFSPTFVKTFENVPDNSMKTQMYLENISDNK